MSPRELFHGLYLPRHQDDDNMAEGTPLHLLWTRDEALDNNNAFSPDHFVPLCFTAKSVEASASKDKSSLGKRKSEDENLSFKKKPS